MKLSTQRRRKIYEELKKKLESNIVGAEVDIRHLNRLLIKENQNTGIANQLTKIKAQKEAYEGMLLTLEDEIKDYAK